MKVIIWGHKLYSHTHSFVHYGFYKAFKHMGYDTYWMDNNDDVSTFDFSNCIFLTEGQVCEKMPVRDDCKYILHHVCGDFFTENFKDKNNFISMGVYNKDCLNFEKINDYTFCREGKFIAQPWATDLLPHEIDTQLIVPDENKDKNIYFIGTVTSGANDIFRECIKFATAATDNGISFVIKGGYSGGRPHPLLKVSAGFVDMEESIALIRKAYLAPTFQSIKQRNMQYIPCRIFKNISYGQYPVTNCKHVQFLFPGLTIYNEDTYELFLDTEKKKNNKDLVECMNIIKEHHTFINRIERLMDIL